MKITIKDFLSLKNVEFDIEKGITAIAGLNGSGKSQLLLGLHQSQTQMHYTISTNGFSNVLAQEVMRGEKITIEPKPNLVLFRPAIRKLAESTLQQEYATLTPTSSLINGSENGLGYYYGYESRFSQLYTLVANSNVWGNREGAKPEQKKPWKIISESFKAVFNKELSDDGGPQSGIKIGLKLTNGEVTSFNTLSTGELEFISLLSDLLIENATESDGKFADLILVDELDAHFHPDLQRKVIENIKDLCKDKYVIITTHSPSVMLSVNSNQLYFLNRAEDCKDTNNGNYKNQITLLTRDSDRFRYIAEMYSGFFSDARFADYMRDAEAYAIQKFADECLGPSEAIGGDKANSADPQTSSLRGIISTQTNPTIIEVGCGKGRTLAMLKDFDQSTLKSLTYIGVDNDEDNLKEIREYAETFPVEGSNLASVLGERFIITKKIKDDMNADICIFANVIHELGVENIANTLNDYLHHIKEGGLLAIYEVDTLKLGEMNYVMFSRETLKLLFEDAQTKKQVSIQASSPQSRSGSLLMEVTITVHNPTEIQISNEDVMKALDKIIESEAEKLLKHKSNEARLSGMEYGFSTNNLANAFLGKKLLMSRPSNCGGK